MFKLQTDVHTPKFMKRVNRDEGRARDVFISRFLRKPIEEDKLWVFIPSSLAYEAKKKISWHSSMVL